MGISESGSRRSIRSFVRRTGRMTGAQKGALERLWPRFGIDPGCGPIDLDGLFGRETGRVLEIGFGNGEVLVEQARQKPDLDFLGVEVHLPGVGHCLLQAEAANVANLRVICADVVEVLQRQLGTGSFCRVNLYFPDPWPKKRHHKRRLVQPEFLNLVAGALETGGAFCIATDWRNYAEHIDELLIKQDRFDVALRREHSGDQPLDRPNTKFERRGLLQGHRIWEWRLLRV